MKSVNRHLSSVGTTIFTVMSALALEHDAINLGQGFPDTEAPADVVQAAADALLDGRNQYPPMPGVSELRQAVANANKRFYGLDVDWASEVVVTSGATEAVTACLIAVLNPGDEIVLIEPLYDTYLPVVRMLGAVPKLVRLEPPEWTLPHAALADAFGPATKAILLNSQMNPCGKVLTADELSFIAELLLRQDAYAICDEVYEHLTSGGKRHIPFFADRFPLNDQAKAMGPLNVQFTRTGSGFAPVTVTMVDGEVLHGTARPIFSGGVAEGYAFGPHGGASFTDVAVGPGTMQMVLSGPRTQMLCRANVTPFCQGTGECRTYDGAAWTVGF